jgi:hypothetical protein
MKRSRTGIDVLWMLRHPVITVFKKDVHNWVRSVSDRVAFRLYNKNRELVEKYVEEDNYEPLERIAHRAAEIQASKVNDKIIGERYIVIASGSFGPGERYCSVEDASDFVDNLWKELTIEILNALASGIWTKEDLSGRGEANFEYTLHNYIPSIFKDNLLEWKEDISSYIVYRILKGELNLDSPEQMIREEISNKLDEIIEELGNLKSEYVNIVDDVEEDIYSMRRTATCRIVPVAKFVDNLYKMAYNRSLEILAEAQNNPQDDE